jgi:hypothetical protein
MTTVPIPTFVPQDAWYNLTTGDVNPSVADTVPNINYLRPSATPLGLVDGVVGPLDGAIIGLAGTSSTFDGGQTWLMWDDDSLLADNGVTVFCPFADTGTPGRWRAISNPAAPSGPTTNVQFFEAGADYTIAASSAPFIQVFVQGRVANLETNLALPGAVTVGQVISVKDAEGDATTYNINVTAPSIDGQPAFTLYTDYQGQNFTWNGTEFSAT